MLEYITVIASLTISYHFFSQALKNSYILTLLYIIHIRVRTWIGVVSPTNTGGRSNSNIFTERLTKGGKIYATNERKN